MEGGNCAASVVDQLLNDLFFKVASVNDVHMQVLKIIGFVDDMRMADKLPALRQAVPLLSDQRRAPRDSEALESWSSTRADLRVVLDNKKALEEFFLSPSSHQNLAADKTRRKFERRQEIVASGSPGAISRSWCS